MVLSSSILCFIRVVFRFSTLSPFSSICLSRSISLHYFNSGSKSSTPVISLNFKLALSFHILPRLSLNLRHIHSPCLCIFFLWCCCVILQKRMILPRFSLTLPRCPLHVHAYFSCVKRCQRYGPEVTELRTKFSHFDLRNWAEYWKGWRRLAGETRHCRNSWRSAISNPQLCSGNSQCVLRPAAAGAARAGNFLNAAYCLTLLACSGLG